MRLWAGYLFLLAALILARPQPLWALVGIILILIGAAIRLIASATLVKDSELCTSGIYSATRNPLYLGSALVGLGFVSLSYSLWLLVAFVLVLVPLYARTILLEERYLKSLFPESYPEYASRVPRFVPRLVPLPDFAGTVDRRRLLKSRELQSAVSFAILAALIFILHRTWIPG